ncbi:palindromic element RPE5 domain-containing protein [Rickettsia japonica]|uniref:Palindromic element RPE5 domain-containing protein n=1 Tax=Rickettsia japonica TaxID=35790 RepID=A0ABN5P1Q9_RICJA|nr:palindromic element RPE5 domain-containing protein [Rickettsia japonica]AXU06169.1 palindromic element RPE5 domain-containing protein [Rickettsia japonica]QHE24847.1 palindromic element RPE5 domain-containing protein [Rickettsia japonica]
MNYLIHTKISLEKSKGSISRGAERILNVQHPRTYKDDTANFSSSILVYLYILFIKFYGCFTHFIHKVTGSSRY